MKIFLDREGGGAWPFLVGGVICLVNSVNERDLDLLNRPAQPFHGLRTIPARGAAFLGGLPVRNRWKFEAITGL